MADTGNNKYDIFLCYDTRDKEFAEIIYHFLSKYGYKIFLKTIYALPTNEQEYRTSIAKFINQSKHIIIVASNPEYLKSEFVCFEWKLFISRNTLGIPAGKLITMFAESLTANQIPAELSRFESLPLTQCGLTDLVEAINLSDSKNIKTNKMWLRQKPYRSLPIIDAISNTQNAEELSASQSVVSHAAVSTAKLACYGHATNTGANNLSCNMQPHSPQKSIFTFIPKSEFEKQQISTTKDTNSSIDEIDLADLFETQVDDQPKIQSNQTSTKTNEPSSNKKTDSPQKPPLILVSRNEHTKQQTATIQGVNTSIAGKNLENPSPPLTIDQLDTQRKRIEADKHTAKFTYDVFICHNNRDFSYAKEVYDFLTAHDKHVFLSEITLPTLGSCDYMKEIDFALEKAGNMIIVGSHSDHITSSWVEAEWRIFINEKRSGRKDGNVITITTEKLAIEDLPPSLRYYEVLPFSPQHFEKILRYIK
jgi:hypothetical protein